MQPNRTGRATNRRGAAIYTVVVFNALLVGVLGLSALSIVRIERQQNVAASDQAIARENAVSAVAVALAHIKNDASWRSTFSHNTQSSLIGFGTGTATWRLVDAVDTSLSNNPRHGVFIEGIGRCGNAAWVERVEARQPELPLPTLTCAVHSGSRLKIDSGCRLTVLNGAASTNTELQVNGTLAGDGRCLSKTAGGAVTGTLTTGLTARENPPSSTLVAAYRDRATWLTYSGAILKDLLGPGVNTYSGSTNAEGLYYINSGSSTLVIDDSRLLGTLIVKGNVSITDTVLMQPASRECPALIVDGDLTLQFTSARFLTESAAGRNLNPSAAPFAGVSDADTTDVYPSEIRGLVHVTGNLMVTSDVRVVGLVLVDGEARFGSDCVIQRDPVIAFTPPTGYWTATPGPLELKRNGWQRAAAP
jgi:hypothetical protein